MAEQTNTSSDKDIDSVRNSLRQLSGGQQFISKAVGNPDKTVGIKPDPWKLGSAGATPEPNLIRQAAAAPDPITHVTEQAIDIPVVASRDVAVKERISARERLAAAREAISRMLSEIAKSADPWRIDEAQKTLEAAYTRAEEGFVDLSLRSKDRVIMLLAPAAERLRKFADKYEPHAIALRNRVKAEAQKAGLRLSEEGSRLLYTSKNGADLFIATMSEMCIKFLKRKNERARSRVFFRKREWNAALELKRSRSEPPQEASSDQSTP